MTARYLDRNTLHALYGNSPDAVMVERFEPPYPEKAARPDLDVVATIAYVNPGFTELLAGYGLPVQEGTDTVELQQLLAEYFDSQFADRWESRQQRIDNLQLAALLQSTETAIPPLMLSTTPIIEDGMVCGCWTRITDASAAVGRDTAERRAMRQLDAFVRTENVPLICLEFAEPVPGQLSVEGLNHAYHASTITHMTQSAAQLFGATPEELLNRSLLELNNERIEMLLSNAFPSTQSHQLLNLGDTPQILVDMPSAKPSVYRVKPTFVFDNQRAVEVWLRVEDITSAELRARQQKALEQTRRLALEAANLHQFQVNNRTGKLTVDSAGLQQMGFAALPTELAGWIELLRPENVNIPEDKIHDIFTGKTRDLNFIARLTNDHGEEKYLEVWGVVNSESDLNGPARTIGLYRDATHTEKLNARLSEKKTLESLGVLAGGVAHDFNNLLMSVLGYAELMEADILDAPHRDSSPLLQASMHNIDEIRAAALRASELCTSLLAYAGQHLIEKKTTDLTELVRSTAELVQVTIGKRVPLLFDLDNEVRIAADKGQLTQVIVNLVGNAGDAMEGYEGFIQIGVAAIVLEPEEQALVADQLDEPDARLACLTVRDSGCGMSAVTQQRMFEPFYTTKSEGRGLGMAAVHGIVKNHGGVILVDSQEGRGTEFRVCFPLLARLPTSEQFVSRSPTQSRENAPRVLVVDDESGVRTIAAEMLRHLSCDVMEAESAEAALALFANNTFDYVLLDITMPVMSGSELAELLLERVPDLQVVLCSGYTEKDVPESLLKRCRFIHKPYTLSEISDTLNLNAHSRQALIEA